MVILHAITILAVAILAYCMGRGRGRLLERQRQYDLQRKCHDEYWDWEG